MITHFYADYTLKSNNVIGELLTTGPTFAPDFSFTLHKSSQSDPELKDIKSKDQQIPLPCQPYQSLFRKGDRFLLRFFEHADFLISKDGCQIDVWQHPETSNETITHLLLDQVLPRLLDLHGHLLIHASSVCVDKKVIAFIGESGVGKSTLSASLHLNGHRLLSDDGLLIKLVDSSISVVPTYHSLRLWPDSISHLYTKEPAVTPVAQDSEKLRVVSAGSDENRIKENSLAEIYLLAPTDDKNSSTISITQLRPIEACMTILSNSFQFDVNDKKRAAARLKQAAQLSRIVPVFRLQYPRDFSRLPELQTAIIRHHEHTVESPDIKFNTASHML